MAQAICGWTRPPRPQSVPAMTFSPPLKQLAATVPQAGQLKIEDFLDRSLVSELEREGFISKIYEGR